MIQQNNQLIYDYIQNEIPTEPFSFLNHTVSGVLSVIPNV